MNNRNIAIDGPAGAGKSTIAKTVAARLGLVYVDTGAMYRAMALYCIRQGISADDREAISEACRYLAVSLIYRDGSQEVWLNGEDVTPFLRGEDVGRMASAISVYAPVREKLVELQRQIAAEKPVIMDGRDIGTVVLPDAVLKIYLTASVEERAQRRYRELLQQGVAADPEVIRRDIRDRDDRDEHRSLSPLRRAADAVLLDSSDLTIEETADRIIELYRGVTAEDAG